jgi:subfamily B ATP-binding cassette protein HlyB/CyaB
MADDADSVRTGQAASGSLQALRAVCLVARLHHIAVDPEQLAHQLGWPPSHMASIADLLLAAKQIGLKPKLSRTHIDRLALTPLPALALLKGEEGVPKVVVLAQCDGQRVLFQDPSGAIQGGRPTIEPIDVFASQWTGELILITSRASLAGELAKFDFSWFIPSIVKYRRLLGEVLIVSLFLQLFALVSPLFFQVVMDKVLVHRGLTTLDVLVTGLVVIVLFESLLTILRTYVFSHTTSRIDVELGARLFRHLLNLPLAYFQARRVGDSVARVRELENIRSFLTGNALTLVLDVVFSVIFIAMMFAYSVPLTLIVLVSLPLYLALSLTLMPILRARLNEKFARGAENQALLVEAVTGIQTVKASALEPAMARRWDQQLAGYTDSVTSSNDTYRWGIGSGLVC